MPEQVFQVPSGKAVCFIAPWKKCGMVDSSRPRSGIAEWTWTNISLKPVANTGQNAIREKTVVMTF